MIYTIKASKVLPGHALLLLAICCVILAPTVFQSAEYKNLKAPQNYAKSSEVPVFIYSSLENKEVKKVLFGL